MESLMGKMMQKIGSEIRKFEDELEKKNMEIKTLQELVASQAKTVGDRDEEIQQLRELVEDQKHKFHVFEIEKLLEESKDDEKNDEEEERGEEEEVQTVEEEEVQTVEEEEDQTVEEEVEQEEVDQEEVEQVEEDPQSVEITAMSEKEDDDDEEEDEDYERDEDDDDEDEDEDEDEEETEEEEITKKRKKNGNDGKSNKRRRVSVGKSWWNAFIRRIGREEGEDGSHRCIVCPKIGNSKQALTYHVTKKHADLKKFC